MAKFIYNNAKIANTGQIPFELNCRYHFCVLYKEDIDLHFKSKSVYKLLVVLREIMIICQKNFYHVQKLQKRAHNQGVKPQSYASGNKVWLNSKYIKV